MWVRMVLLQCPLIVLRPRAFLLQLQQGFEGRGFQESCLWRGTCGKKSLLAFFCLPHSHLGTNIIPITLTRGYKLAAYKQISPLDIFCLARRMFHFKFLFYFLPFENGKCIWMLFWQVTSASVEMHVISLAPGNTELETPTWLCRMQEALTT